MSLYCSLNSRSLYLLHSTYIHFVFLIFNHMIRNLHYFEHQTLLDFICIDLDVILYHYQYGSFNLYYLFIILENYSVNHSFTVDNFNWTTIETLMDFNNLKMIAFIQNFIVVEFDWSKIYYQFFHSNFKTNCFLNLKILIYFYFNCFLLILSLIQTKRNLK